MGAYRFDGGWSRLAVESTGGSQPCYLSISSDESVLAVANYGSGSIAWFDLDPASGLPTGPAEVRAHAGSGPNRDRQEGPHAHCAYFDPGGRWLFQVDLGTDEILAWPLGSGGEAHTAYRAPPGSGPRQLLWHHGGGRAFLVSELASTIDLLDVDDLRWQPRQRLSTLPEGYDGESLAGHIAANRSGDLLYLTNRGHDSIALFRFDGDSLSLVQHIDSGGRSPRHLLLLGQEGLLLVAHEESGNVTGFALDGDGRMSPTGLDVDIQGAAFLFEATK